VTRDSVTHESTFCPERFGIVTVRAPTGMRKRSILRGGIRRSGECSDFVELARRMSIPTDVAIHEFMDLGTRPRAADREEASAAETAAGLVTIPG
jgi:hypothetical protein